VERGDQVFDAQGFVVRAAGIMDAGLHYSDLQLQVMIHSQFEGYWLPKTLMVVYVGEEVPGVQARR